MDPKILIIIAISYLYFFFEVFLNLRQKRISKFATVKDKGSLRLLYGLITVGYFLSFAIGATKMGRVYPWNTFFTFGMSLIGLGLFIRIASILTLKHFFTYSVAIFENHQIITTGIYKYIRHPGYLGQLIIFLGISTSMSNWLSILAMLLPITLAYLYRIKVEERFMLEQLGDNYLDYQNRTKRLLPLVF